MPQAQHAAHTTLLELILGHDADDARVLSVLSRLQSSNRALEGLSRALDTGDTLTLEKASCEPAG